MDFDNRITQLLGVELPIVQAPMGFIARAQLASAVSNAGGLGIIETSSGRLDEIREEILKMRELTEKPFGVNIAQAFVRDPEIVQFVIDQGVRFVVTSAGNPQQYTGQLKDAGLTVFHVVPSLRAAEKAVEAGVDGLVVEGGEGGGFKNPRDVSSFVLLPLVRSRVDVPIVAAGGICDGVSMAAAFVLGAEGVQMGTRMVSALESPIHDNWKQAIVRGRRDRHGDATGRARTGAARAAHGHGRAGGAGGQRSDVGADRRHARRLLRRQGSTTALPSPARWRGGSMRCCRWHRFSSRW